MSNYYESEYTAGCDTDESEIIEDVLSSGKFESENAAWDAVISALDDAGFGGNSSTMGGLFLHAAGEVAK